MRSLPFLEKLNTYFRKAAAPNYGTAAFFFSTYLAVLRQNIPFFVCPGFEGAASKKAMLGIGRGLPVMAKNVA